MRGLWRGSLSAAESFFLVKRGQRGRRRRQQLFTLARSTVLSFNLVFVCLWSEKWVTYLGVAAIKALTQTGWNRFCFRQLNCFVVWCLMVLRDWAVRWAEPAWAWFSGTETTVPQHGELWTQILANTSCRFEDLRMLLTIWSCLFNPLTSRFVSQWQVRHNSKKGYGSFKGARQRL